MAPSDQSAKHDSGTSPATYMHEALTPGRFDSTNYVEWSLNRITRSEAENVGVTSLEQRLHQKTRKSDEYEAWEDENCLVKSWLLDSMTKEIISLFIRLATAKDIWGTMQQTYSTNQDASRSYQLYREVISTQQNGSSAITYFGKLQRLWLEYDTITNCTMECPKDAEKYNNMINSQ